jgi:hypothetical protein
VQYTKSKEYQLVLSRWLVLDENDPTAYVCNFPKKVPNEAEYQNAIKNSQDLPGSTRPYKAHLAYTTTSYPKGNRKLDKLIAGVETTSESDNATSSQRAGATVTRPPLVTLNRQNSVDEELKGLKLEVLLLKDMQDG